MSQYKFFQHRECEFFPCHENADPAEFNCIFCYCPLYALGENCGGSFRYTPGGIKDCSGCLYPHRRENYDSVCKKLMDILELKKKRPENP